MDDNVTYEITQHKRREKLNLNQLWKGIWISDSQGYLRARNFSVQSIGSPDSRPSSVITHWKQKGITGTGVEPVSLVVEL
jgi:hypothetical protein